MSSFALLPGFNPHASPHDRVKHGSRGFPSSRLEATQRRVRRCGLKPSPVSPWYRLTSPKSSYSCLFASCSVVNQAIPLAPGPKSSVPSRPPRVTSGPNGAKRRGSDRGSATQSGVGPRLRREGARAMPGSSGGMESTDRGRGGRGGK